MASALVIAGLLAGAAWGTKGGDRTDILSAGFAGGLLGLLTAAVGYALMRSAESILGSWSTSLPVVLLFWWLLGAALALLSGIALPPHLKAPKTEPTP
jgi:hypothetical protein